MNLDNAPLSEWMLVVQMDVGCQSMCGASDVRVDVEEESSRRGCQDVGVDVEEENGQMGAWLVFFGIRQPHFRLRTSIPRPVYLRVRDYRYA